MLQNSSLQEMPGTSHDAERTFIVFRVAGNLFGVNIESIREIIEPSHITRVPLAPPFISGIINVRGVIIPAIDLYARLYGSGAVNIRSSDFRIFICEIKDGPDTVLMGGLVDAVVSVTGIDEMEITNSPEFGSKVKPDFIRCVGRMHDRHIMILDTGRVFDIDDLALNSFIKTGKNENPDAGSRDYGTNAAKNAPGKEMNEESGEKAGCILFAVGDGQYGIGTDRVLEIVRVEEMKRLPLPNAMPFMKGIINIRNTAIPLVDMRLRCGLAEKEYTADTAALIVDTAGRRVGLVVDSITAVTEIRADTVQNTLHYSAEIDRDFISGMAEQDGRFTVLINADRILSGDELRGLDSLADEENAAGTA